MYCVGKQGRVCTVLVNRGRVWDMRLSTCGIYNTVNSH